MDKVNELIESYKTKHITLEECLSCYTDDTTYEFDILLTRLIDAVEEREFLEMLNNEDMDDSIRYAALYALCIRYRRYKEFTLYYDILTNWRNEFSYKKSFLVLEAIFYKSRNNKEDILIAFELWKSCQVDIENNPAMIQAYADTVAIAFENGHLDINTDENQKILTRSVYLIRRAIELKQYPKYYATLGKLLALKGDYDEAEKNVKIAMDKESSNGKDYAIRISDYQSVLAKISINRYSSNQMDKMLQISGDMEKIKSEIETSKFDSITFLGFFSAILSLIIGSVQIVSSQTDFSQAFRIIMVLGGMLIIMLDCLEFLIRKNNNIVKTLIVLFFGIFILVVAFWILPAIGVA